MFTDLDHEVIRSLAEKLPAPAPYSYWFENGEIVVAVKSEQVADLVPTSIGGMRVRSQIDIGLEPVAVIGDLGTSETLEDAILAVADRVRSGDIA